MGTQELGHAVIGHQYWTRKYVCTHAILTRLLSLLRVRGRGRRRGLARWRVTAVFGTITVTQSGWTAQLGWDLIGVRN